jgi:HNH endonuclease
MPASLIPLAPRLRYDDGAYRGLPSMLPYKAYQRVAPSGASHHVHRRVAGAGKDCDVLTGAMKPYYQHAGKSEAHKKAIGEGQRRAWATKRKRLPIGSKWTDAGGYIRVKVTPGAGRWRLEHVLVMEKLLGRALRPGEIVHHINGVRSDNRAENLFLCTGQTDHNNIEKSLTEAFRILLEAGKASFNRETRRYEAIL